MRLRTLKPEGLAGKRVLVRIDGNVPVHAGRAVEGNYGRIARAAVGIEWLRQHGARTIVVTHLGRPAGKRVSAYSVRPVAKRLSELLGMKVAVARGIAGPDVERAVARMNDGDVLLLENVRFDPREEENSPSLARGLAALADIYVNDGFGVSHRAHASTDAITSELPSFAGPLMAKEIQVLSSVVDKPARPFILAMGGLKMADKIPVMERLLPKADAIFVGGALATAFLKAQGLEVGASVYDLAGVEAAHRLLKKSEGKIQLPTDVLVAKSLRRGAKTRVTSVDAVLPNERIVDVGPDSVAAALAAFKTAKTIVWNGPFGYGEGGFRAASERLARGISARTGKAMTVVGGGDTVPMVEELAIADAFTLLSTGGGAMLEFLAGKKLPGVEALKA